MQKLIDGYNYPREAGHQALYKPSIQAQKYKKYKIETYKIQKYKNTKIPNTCKSW